MLTLFTIFIAVAGAGFAFWFYNKRQVKTLADQIDDKNAVINAFRNHVEDTSTLTENNVDTPPRIQYQKNNSQQKTTNGGNKNHQNDNKSSTQKKQKSQNSKSNQSSEKKNRPRPRKSKTQQ